MDGVERAGWAGEGLGVGDKDRFGTRGLVASSTFGRRDADETRGWASAIGGVGELGLDDGLDVVNGDEDVLWFEIGVDEAAVPVHVVQSQ